MKTTKSTLKLARMALAVARDSLPDHAKAKSPKKFTQPQLLACLVIKEFLQLDYRGIQMLLSEWSDLRDVLGLTQVPHFTTLCAAAKRLLNKGKADTVLDAVLAHCRQAKLLKKRSRQAAIDSTGLESRYVSAYFTTRCKRHSAHYKTRYPKLSAVCDIRNHLILGIVIDRGPKPDPVEAEATLYDAWNRQPFSTLLGDAGYESEGFHCLCCDTLGVRSIIPTTERGRPRLDGKPRPVRGHYRKLLKQRFPKKTYGQRWQIETVFSMLKRNLGSALRARTYHSQNREIRLRVLTHNLAILWRRPPCSIQSRTATYLWASGIGGCPRLASCCVWHSRLLSPGNGGASTYACCRPQRIDSVSTGLIKVGKSMVRLPYVIGTCAILAAGAVFINGAAQWHQGDPELVRLQSQLSVVEAFRQQEDQRDEAREQAASPLLVQAQVFADILNPPVTAAAKEIESASVPGPLARTPSTSLRAGSQVPPRFRVVAVSCYPQRPERSMALIEPTIGGEAKWVKEGAQVGHFVVHEIRQGLVVLRNGEQRCELPVERSRTSRTLVRDVRPGSRQVIAAGLDGASMPETRSETDR